MVGPLLSLGVTRKCRSVKNAGSFSLPGIPPVPSPILRGEHSTITETLYFLLGLSGPLVGPEQELTSVFITREVR